MRLIIDKLRETLRPNYKQFVAKQIAENNMPLIPFHKFRLAITLLTYFLSAIWLVMLVPK